MSDKWISGKGAPTTVANFFMITIHQYCREVEQRMTDIFDNRYYRFNRYLMAVIGHWPYQPANQRLIQCIFLYLAIGTVTLVQGLKLIHLWGNIDMMVECMVPMGVQVVAFMKSSNCVSNNVKMKKLMDLMKKDWADLTDKEEINVLMSYVEEGCLLGLIYGACVYGSVTIYLIIPLMPQVLDVIIPLNETRPRQFLYETEYYVNQDHHYASIMTHNYVGTILTITVIVSVDTMLLAYVYHVCGMFAIIGNRLENTMRSADLNVIADLEVESQNVEKVYAYIADCVKDHRKVIEFATLMETSYSLSFLFQIAASMLMISATGLQVVTKLGQYHEVFRLGQFIIGQLVHLFFNSLPSQMLMDHTHRFRNSLYFADWYRFPVQGRHLLRLAMLKSLKPCKMTAGKLYDMSMESFAKVVQTSMSYFTVLVSLR